MTTKPGHNVACHIEDFSDEDLRALIRDLFPEEARSDTFPRGLEHRSHWEAAMTMRALRDFGALQPGSRLLGVGFGAHPLVFHLTRLAEEVVSASRCFGKGAESEGASLLLIASPQSAARTAFDPRRLTVRLMDERVLEFPDEAFDGIFASAEVGRSLDDEDVAAAAFEMGRVLRPGGVLTMALDVLVMGPPGARGFPGRRLFVERDIQRLIVDASGLDLADDLDLRVSPATLETPRDIEAILEDRETERGSELPHLVAVHQGQVYTSAHLTLRKGPRWPARDNSWAAPSASLRVRVRSHAEDSVARLLNPPREALPLPPSAAGGSRGDRPTAGRREALREAFDAWDAVRSQTAITAPSWGPFLRRAAGFLARTTGRVRNLGILWDRERDLFRALIARQDELEQRLRDLIGRGDR